MELLSRTYGWTPEQIRNLTIEDVEHYMEILQERARIQKAEIAKSKSRHP